MTNTNRKRQTVDFLAAGWLMSIKSIAFFGSQHLAFQRFSPVAVKMAR
jgi:hypothetical protein